jgi:hypothetical protein
MAMTNSTPSINQVLPVTQTYQGYHINALNFPPADFNFYQKAPLWDPVDSLAINGLSGALNFTNSSSYLACTNVKINNSNPWKQFTIEFWVKTSTSGSSSSTVFSYSGSAGSISLSYPGKLSLNLNNTAYAISRSIADGLWHHVAIVVKSGEIPQLYLDTKSVSLSGTQVYNTLLGDGGTLNVSGTGSGSDWFQNGWIGQFRVWNVARNLNDIIYGAGRVLLSSETANLHLYWNDGFENTGTGQATFYDTSGHGSSNDGTVYFPHQTTIWNSTVSYGALLDDGSRVPEPLILTGNLVLDRAQKQYVSLYPFSWPVGSDATTALTFELWVKASSGNLSTSNIFALLPGDNSQTSEIILLRNPANLTIANRRNGQGNVGCESGVSLVDGRWHHIALVWENTDTEKQILLYVDGESLSLSSAPQVDLNLPGSPLLEVGGAKLSPNVPDNYFDGCVGEFRLWTEARNPSQIKTDMATRIVAPPAELLVYWPFARRPSNSLAEDFSIYDHAGVIHHNPVWEDSETFGVLASQMQIAPTPESSNGSGSPSTAWGLGGGDIPPTPDSLTDDSLLPGAADGFPPVTKKQLVDAFNKAHDTGYFDAIVFPNIFGLDAPEDHAKAKAAIADLTSDVFLNAWLGNRRLSLALDGSGNMYYEFVPVLTGYGPTLFLLYSLQISSFFGALGEGRVVRSYSLLPGEVTYLSIETYKRSEQTASKASSILDSKSEASTSSFENSVERQTGVKAGIALALALNASVNIKGKIMRIADADVNGGFEFDGNASLEGTLQNTTNALREHAQEASASRDVEVNTSYVVETESGSQTSITRQFQNVNQARTLNILFRQLNQEFIAAQQLVDIRVGYFDPEPGSFRTVQLYEVDDLLDQVLLDDPGKKSTYKQTIVEQAMRATQLAMSDYSVRGDFIECRDITTGEVVTYDPDQIASQIFFVNNGAYTEFYLDPQTLVNLNGLVLKRDSIVMRTDNVVADVALGEGVGLDEFALNLQQQSIQRQTAETDRLNLENAKLQAALDILQLAKNSGQSAAQLAELYRELFPPVVPTQATIIEKGEVPSTGV